MKTEFQGEPVAGGTFPAGIWKTFMQAVLKIDPPPELKDEGRRRGRRRARPPSPAPRPRPPRPRRRRRRPRPPQTQRRRHRRRDDPPNAASEPDAEAAGQPAAGRTGADRGTARQRRRDAALAAAPARRRPPARARRAGPACPAAPSATAGDRARARRAEAPRQLGRLGDADARADERAPAPPSRAAAARCAIGPPSRSEPLRSSSMPSAWVSLPGPLQRSSVARHARAARASARAPRAAPARGSAPRRRRPRPRQTALKQRVDAVGAVDVGARRAGRTGCACAPVSPTCAWQAGSDSW